MFRAKTKILKRKRKIKKNRNVLFSSLHEMTLFFNFNTKQKKTFSKSSFNDQTTKQPTQMLRLLKHLIVQALLARFSQNTSLEP